ncbi:MAG TPA: hypothetical protein VKU89_09910 [Solirubrobacteraceae bacterium]|nr:hypothetical protein [Solirubrobacteraceae bacterium]
MPTGDSVGGFSGAHSIDYDRCATACPARRRADPRIAARICAALGEARSVVNVGAGCGSYEPEERHVIAIEPSAGMWAQRPAQLAPAIAARAEALPLGDDCAEAAMAVTCVYHSTISAPVCASCAAWRVARWSC